MGVAVLFDSTSEGGIKFGTTDRPVNGYGKYVCIQYD